MKKSVMPIRSSSSVFAIACFLTLACATPEKKQHNAELTSLVLAEKAAFLPSKNASYRDQELLYMGIWHLRKDYFQPLSDYQLLKLWLTAPVTQKTWPQLKYREAGEALTITCGKVSRAVSASDFQFENFWPLYDEVAAPCLAVKTDDFNVTYVLLKAIISGLQEGMEFYTPAENSEFQTDIWGNFGSVGLEIALRSGKMVIVDTISGSPAEKAGLLKGDTLLSIDDKPLQTPTLTEIVKMLRGKLGSSVSIKVQRGQETKPREYQMVREKITIWAVKAMPGNKQVMHLQVRHLNVNAISDLNTNLERDNRDLLLDLRGCPGGLLDAAHSFSGVFLPKGAHVLSSRGRRKELDKVFVANNEKPDLKRKIVVLTDSRTAGGCEIIAAALKHHGRARLVGEPTYGRGTIQNVISMIYGTAMVLTIQEIILPDGKSLIKRPVVPDVLMTQEDDASAAAMRLFE